MAWLCKVCGFSHRPNVVQFPSSSSPCPIALESSLFSGMALLAYLEPRIYPYLCPHTHLILKGSFLITSNQVKAASTVAKRTTIQHSSISSRADHQKQAGTHTGRNVRDRSKHGSFPVESMSSDHFNQVLVDWRSNPSLIDFKN